MRARDFSKDLRMAWWGSVQFDCNLYVNRGPITNIEYFQIVSLYFGSGWFAANTKYRLGEALALFVGSVLNSLARLYILYEVVKSYDLDGQATEQDGILHNWTSHLFTATRRRFNAFCFLPTAHFLSTNTRWYFRN